MGRMAYAVCELAPLDFAGPRRGNVAVQPPLVPPDANAGPRFNVKLFENVLHVLLDGARAAFENFADLVVAFSGNDPFHNFELALGQVGRLVLSDA